jgi:hypothetical protein
MKRLDFGNQMATFPNATNFGSNPGPTLSPHGSTIPLAATYLLIYMLFNLNTFSWKAMQPTRLRRAGVKRRFDSMKQLMLRKLAAASGG